MKADFIQDQTFWYLKGDAYPPLRTSITADVVVVGGGMAGLTAAQSFRQKGLEVVLLEKNYCGAGASGKSSGFITPNSELSLYDLEELYNKESAQLLWDFVSSGVQHIRENIKRYQLSCDFQEQKTLVVARDKKSYEKMLITEQQARVRYGLTSELLLQEELYPKLASQSYYGGILYADSFGIKAYDYCSGMKEVLRQDGVQIYEESLVTQLLEHEVRTTQGAVKAKYIVVCLDHFIRELHALMQQVYHVQTFLMMSNQLTDKQIAAIFPDEHFLVWDTELVYNYFRVTGDNRLMFGGASLLYTYAQHEAHASKHMIRKLTDYFKQQFKNADVDFCYMWPGLIGVSKDLLPVAGFDKTNKSIYYIAAATGLPWAAALGAYSAQRILDDKRELDPFFDPYRFSAWSSAAQALVGAPASFALSHALRVSSL